MYVSIAGKSQVIENKVELITHMKELEDFAEVSIGGHRTTAMVALLNAERAMLLYIREPGDHGFHTLNIQGDRKRQHSFKLSNGQADQYPEHWLCSREAGIMAIIHYYNTGHMTPHLDWISQRSLSV